MRTMTPGELREAIKAGKSLMLLDVREVWEREQYNIGGIHLPMDELMERRDEIPMDMDVIIYCEKGIRSSIVIQRLEGLGFSNLINLSGGMKAWKESER